MSRRAIALIPFVLGMLSMPAQAAPTEAEIDIFAQRICDIQGTSEKDYIAFITLKPVEYVIKVTICSFVLRFYGD